MVELNRPAGRLAGVRRGESTVNVSVLKPGGKLIVELLVSKVTWPLVIFPAISSGLAGAATFSVWLSGVFSASAPVEMLLFGVISMMLARPLSPLYWLSRPASGVIRRTCAG